MVYELTLEIAERVKLGESASARGVLHENDAPLQDRAVWLWVGDMGMGNAKTDEAGTYEFQITFLDDKAIAQGEIVREVGLGGAGEKTIKVEFADYSGEIGASSARKIQVEGE